MPDRFKMAELPSLKVTYGPQFGRSKVRTLNSFAHTQFEFCVLMPCLDCRKRVTFSFRTRWR